MPDNAVPEHIKEQLQRMQQPAEQTPTPAPPPAGLTEDNRQKAVSAFASVGVNIEQTTLTGDSTPAPNNTPDNELAARTAEKIASADRVGYDQGKVIEKMTRDDFVRD